MNRGEIIKLAQEAGGRQANYHQLYDYLLMSTDALERFFHLAAAAGADAALEAAARQALERLRKYHHGHGFAEDAECIAALRDALKEKA